MRQCHVTVRFQSNIVCAVLILTAATLAACFGGCAGLNNIRKPKVIGNPTGKKGVQVRLQHISSVPTKGGLPTHFFDLVVVHKGEDSRDIVLFTSLSQSFSIEIEDSTGHRRQLDRRMLSAGPIFYWDEGHSRSMKGYIELGTQGRTTFAVPLNDSYYRGLGSGPYTVRASLHTESHGDILSNSVHID